jgi:alpha-L-arabinofuranosidase
MKNYKHTLLLILSGILLSLPLFSQQEKPVIVKVNEFKADIQPTMWGIFFEDINFAADGGIYAELVKNRSFEFANPLMGWQILDATSSNGLQIYNRGESNKANPRFAHIVLGQDDSICLINVGFRGMGIKQNNTYNFSAWIQASESNSLKIKVELISAKNEVLGSTSVAPGSSSWKKYTASLKSSSTDPKGKLKIVIKGKGIVDIDMISLFPADTWKNREQGLRADLVQWLADLKPGFIRFPGGCIVEGRDLANRYQWKNAIGKIEDRPMIVNRWNTEFAHRQTPDYFQSFGMGFFEYFQLAEDIGAEPLPILSCGMACQFNTAELVPMDKLDPYIQDALDLIEFANGATDKGWGEIRAEMGHPKPFNLKMIGIGNEQWGPQYFERYQAFVNTIKAKYPAIKLVSGTGPSPDGKFFEMAAKELKTRKAEIVDEHFYANPEWFLKNATRYDAYDRSSYKIFAGEYAAQSKAVCSPDNENTWRCAIAEAAFMTGLERNADVVNLCSYAPLFAHVEGWQWKPDLIWFDNLSSFGTANYYVQKLFSTNKGTHVLSILRGNQYLAGQDSLYASAVFDKKTGEIILKLVNTSSRKLSVPILLEGAKKLNSTGKLIVLTSNNPEAFNTLNQPSVIVPTEQNITIKNKNLRLNLEANALTIIKIAQVSK